MYKFPIPIRVPMTILVILIILIAIICGILAYQRVDQEGFDLGPNTELSTCPLQSKAYLAKNGDTLCCEGSLSPEGDCTKPLCALAHRKDMPSCKAMLDAANQKEGALFCPPSLPNYYKDGKEVTGCTDGALNNERTAPISASSKTCKIYPNTRVVKNGETLPYTLNDTTSDSCSIQRRREIGTKQMKALFGANFVDMTMNIIGGGIPLFVGYTSFKTPGATMPKMCTSRDEIILFQKHRPLGNPLFSTEAGRSDYIKLVQRGLDEQDCAVQKAIYLDKSMTLDTLKKQRDIFIKAHPALQ
jgi:hypothetical protein